MGTLSQHIHPHVQVFSKTHMSWDLGQKLHRCLTANCSDKSILIRKGMRWEMQYTVLFMWFSVFSWEVELSQGFCLHFLKDIRENLKMVSYYQKVKGILHHCHMWVELL